MRVIYEKSLISKFNHGYLFLDTNALILAVSDDNFLEFLYNLKSDGCALLTIPSVYYEFVSSADTFNKYNLRVGLFTKMGIGVYPIEKNMDSFRDFVYILRKQTDIDYADALLCCCLYQFKPAYVLTENHKHFPTQILDREEIITIDGGKDQIRNMALYKLNVEKYNKAAESLVRK